MAFFQKKICFVNQRKLTFYNQSYVLYVTACLNLILGHILEWVHIWVRAIFYSFLYFNKAFRSPLVSTQQTTHLVSMGSNSLGVKQTTDLRLMSRLRMTAVIPPLPLCNFVLWIRIKGYKSVQFPIFPIIQLLITQSLKSRFPPGFDCQI